MADRGIRGLIRANLSVGDRLGEAFYAIWMVVITIGLLNAEGAVTHELIATVVATAFAVNLVWGIIDGVTVMFGTIIERAERERALYALRSGEASARETVREFIDESILAGLAEAERERVVDLLASGAPGADPRAIRYRASREDWDYALSVVLLDVMLVFPLVVPLVLIPDPEGAIYVSRIVASAMFALLGVAYAAYLNRNRWLAGIGLGGLGYAVFTLAYLAGW